jgi:DNA polymerase III delta prime subunit
MHLSSFDQLSHTTIITGSVQKNLALVQAFLIDQGISVTGNPDVIIFQGEQLLMNDASTIMQFMHQKKTSDIRCIILAYHSLATDVQNRLLKTFEEPHPGTYFFLIIPDVKKILPTILSRAQVMIGEQEPHASRLNTETFLKQSIKERFDTIESITKNKKDEENLLKSEIHGFCDHLENYLWNKNNRDEQLFTDIRMVRNYAGIRGASHRVLLDFLAVRCPILK